MERRFIAWLILSFGIMFLYSSLFMRPQKPPQDEQAQQAAEAEGEGEDGDDAPVDPLEGMPPEPKAPIDGDAAEQPEPKIPQQFVTLGSVDPNSPFRMLVTFSNQGAAVRRVELPNPKYRDLHDDSGYLGHLELSNAAGGGAEVRVVGAGTPAAGAGVQVGDVITAVGPEQTSNVAAVRKALATTEPGDELTLTIRRGENEIRPTTITMIRRPQEVMRPERDNFAAREQAIPDDFNDPMSFRMTLHQLSKQRLKKGSDELPGIKLLQSNWEIASQSETHVEFVKRLSQQQLEVRKRYELAKQDDTSPGYDFKLIVSVKNERDGPRTVAYRLEGPMGLPSEGSWYITRFGRGWFESSGLRDMVLQFEDRDTAQLSATSIAEEDEDIVKPRSGPLAFVGVDSLYFASVLIPDKDRLSDEWLDYIEPLLPENGWDESEKPSWANVSCLLVSKSQTLEAGEQLSHSYTVFAGPKQPSLLAEYKPAGNSAYALDDLVYYGWFFWVARPMLGTLHFFYSIFGNYGVAIILLTVLVRACMLPLSLKQAKNMAKMQELQPELRKLKEKYKNDMEKQARAQQEMFRKNNVNPMGGCLMMFIQLPIFIGLYRGLMLDVELRQAPLISESFPWCDNLGAPDMLLNWASWMPEFIQGFLGPYFNLLPICTIVLFFVQQKLFMPPPTDEQTAMMQKMMKFPMIIIGFLFYKVASGLCLYFIASSVWGIVERKLIPRPVPVTAPAETDTTSSEARKKKRAERRERQQTGSPNGKAGAKDRAKSRKRR